MTWHLQYWLYLPVFPWLYFISISRPRARRPKPEFCTVIVTQQSDHIGRSGTHVVLLVYGILMGSKEFQAYATVQRKFPETQHSTEHQMSERHQVSLPNNFLPFLIATLSQKGGSVMHSMYVRWAQRPGTVLGAKDRKVIVIPSSRGERYVIRW